MMIDIAAVSLLEYCYVMILLLNLAEWLVVCVKDRIVRMAALLIIIIIILTCTRVQRPKATKTPVFLKGE